MKEKKARVEDALHSTRAAVEEGVVPGGGSALIRCLEAVEKVTGDNEDQNVGINIARKAFEAPLRQIVSNGGGEASVVLNEVLKGKGNFGYNAATEDQKTEEMSKALRENATQTTLWVIQEFMNRFNEAAESLKDK